MGQWPMAGEMQALSWLSVVSIQSEADQQTFAILTAHTGMSALIVHSLLRSFLSVTLADWSACFPAQQK